MAKQIQDFMNFIILSFGDIEIPVYFRETRMLTGQPNQLSINRGLKIVAPTAPKLLTFSREDNELVITNLLMNEKVQIITFTNFFANNGANVEALQIESRKDYWESFLFIFLGCYDQNGGKSTQVVNICTPNCNFECKVYSKPV